MRDSYLRDKTAEDFPWMNDVYNETSGFIRFSNKHPDNANNPSARKDNSMRFICLRNKGSAISSLKQTLFFHIHFTPLLNSGNKRHHRFTIFSNCIFDMPGNWDSWVHLGSICFSISLSQDNEHITIDNIIK